MIMIATVMMMMFVYRLPLVLVGTSGYFLATQ